MSYTCGEESCIDLLQNLAKDVSEVNTKLIDNMTNPDMKYKLACVFPDVTTDYFYNNLKQLWEQRIKKFSCSNSDTSNLINLGQNLLARPEFKTILASENPQGEIKKYLEAKTNVSQEDIKQQVFGSIADRIMAPEGANEFKVSPKLNETINNLINVLGTSCLPQSIDIATYIGKAYKQKYKNKFDKMQPDEAKREITKLLMQDYNYLQKFLKDSNKNVNRYTGRMQLTTMPTFSIENELDKLIPNELGTLKQFFIKVISTYYQNLPPIIWAQIYKYAIENFFKDLPLNQEELFAFGSKCLLLNSGAYILKTLQMVRPALTPEVAMKYNLTKLTYPLLEPKQVNLILSKVVKDWKMYKILANYSASVGHVVKVCRVDDPKNVFIIKIIKPVSIAQSCWEYEVLHDIFPKGSCEQQFLTNVLESNACELNSLHEIGNLNKAEKAYNATYEKIFNKKIDATLTAVKNIPGIIDKDCWFALTMTFAEGNPISKLVENKLLEKDTVFRANLHRCLDLFVFQFFKSIIQMGYAHEDAHAANLIYSFKNHLLTMIDFGSVLEIDIKSDPTFEKIIDIIIMSVYYNYDEMLDTLTELLNSRCTEDKNQIIDMKSADYKDFRKKLTGYKYLNTKISDEENKKQETYVDEIFSDKRITEEQMSEKKEGSQALEKEKKIEEVPVRKCGDDPSIYSYLEIQSRPEEVISENEDILPDTIKDVKSKGVSTNFVIQEMLKFYSVNGVNVPIKFSELNSALKAYSLLLGVLNQVHYSPYRMAFVIKKAALNWKNIPSIITITPTIAKTLSKESGEYNDYKKDVKKGNIIERIPKMRGGKKGKVTSWEAKLL